MQSCAMCTYAISRQLLPTLVVHRSCVPRLTVTHSRMVVLSPMMTVVFSPMYFRSCGMAPMTAPGNMRQPLPIRDPLKMVTLGMICVLSPISTSSYTTENASMVTLFPICALGCICAKGLIMLLHSFYYLCYQFGFANQFITDKNSSFHFTNASPDGIHQFHFQDERITGNNFLLELAIVNLEEIRIVKFIRVVTGDRQYAAALRKRFYLQHPGHHIIIREMPLEVRL